MATWRIGQKVRYLSRVDLWAKIPGFQLATWRKSRKRRQPLPLGPVLLGGKR
jgi:hypothetical protein